MPTLKEFEKWLTTSDSASRMGKTRQGVVWMLENGRLRGVRTALGWLVDPQDAARFVPERAPGSTRLGEAEAERWDKEEAIRLLDDEAALLAGYEAEGAQIPANRARQYHERLARAHDAQDMAAYRESINGYKVFARAVYQRFISEGSTKR